MGEAAEPRLYDVRCFRRFTRGKLRRGIWVMTGASGLRGMFIHGDRNEIQGPNVTVEDCANGIGLAIVEEIAPEDVLAEVRDSWPEVVDEIQRCFDRHRIEI